MESLQDLDKHTTMREIKFRVWNNFHKRFLDIPFEGQFESKLAISQNGKMYSGKYDCIMGENQYTIQQYTGIKDKNGKEIYEGDIVEIFNHPQSEQVEWEPNGCGFGFFAHDSKERDSGGFQFLSDWTGSNGYKVIGNIFENPELIKTEV